MWTKTITFLVGQCSHSKSENLPGPISLIQSGFFQTPGAQPRSEIVARAGSRSFWRSSIVTQTVDLTNIEIVVEQDPQRGWQLTCCRLCERLNIVAYRAPNPPLTLTGRTA